MIPTVSIIMPFYGDCSLLERAINSILNQSYKDFILNIGLDGPNDSAEKIFKNIASDRIKIHRLKRQGFINTLDYLARISVTSKYVARMDGDDFSIVDRLKIQVEFLESNPDLSFVSSKYGFIGRNNIKIVDKRFMNSIKDYYLIFKEDLYKNPSIISFNFCDPATIYRVSHLKDVDFYDTDIDNEKPLQLKLLKLSNGVVINQFLHFCDFNLNSHSRDIDNKANEKLHLIREKYGAIISLTTNINHDNYSKFIRVCASTGELGRLLKCFLFLRKLRKSKYIKLLISIFILRRNIFVRV